MFIFDENTFQIEPEFPCPDNEFNSEYIEFIIKIRRHYPELAHWSNAGMYFAWGAYSQDIYAISWVDWVTERDNGFIAYCYISQLRPTFDFGGTGLYDTDIWELGEQEPWKHKQLPVLPNWVF
ncbi:hypothetical protein ACP179_01550 (plasmid) [Xenorhabdus stockiae]|uniref:hypothetical protein n=1 Tax=Xenorhabdus stockiae TaxID=351614 RepID=UPI003CF82BB0